MNKLVDAGKSILAGIVKRKVSKALFLHIQKTAGSSIVALAVEHYGKKNVISHGDFMGHKPQNFQDVDFVSGHFGYTFSKSLMKSRYSFTFLRDPVQRVLSHYYFCRGRNPDEFETYRLANELSLDEFLESALKNGHLKRPIYNNQTWQLAQGYAHGTDRYYSAFKEEEMLELALGHLEEFSHVGFTETFEADRDIVFNKLGIPLPEEAKIINATRDRPSVQNLPDSTVELLREVTRLDQVLYDYAWSNRFL